MLRAARGDRPTVTGEPLRVGEHHTAAEAGKEGCFVPRAARACVDEAGVDGARAERANVSNRRPEGPFGSQAH